jgi:Zn-finger nucleic acid-binding protein
MKSRAATKEISLELKYCERCGGLWLRPAGGDQIYCRVCAGAMAELPPSSLEIRHRTAPSRRRSRAKTEGCTFVGVEPAAGGVI